VAVTFTEKAAGELRARIRAAVAAEPEASAETLAELEAAQISTIHALAARICRDHYDLAGIPPDFAVLDEEEGAIWRVEHFSAALEAIPLDTFRAIPFSMLSQALRTFLQDPQAAEEALEHGPDHWVTEIERARNAELQRLREHPDWRSYGAELGNTRGAEGDKLEIYRAAAFAAWQAVEAGGFAPEHFAALCGVKVNVGAQKNWPADAVPLMKEALKRIRELAGSARAMATLAMGELDRRVAALLPLFLDSFRLVQQRMDEAKRRTRRLDFNDLERYALEILNQPAAQKFYHERWRAFLIDEFQDTNPVQGELLKLLTKGARLTIVGDEQQSIYGFRRAEVEVFRGFRRRIGEEGGEPHELTESYRAHGPLTDRINAVFSSVLGPDHRGLRAERVSAPHDPPHLTALVVEAEARTPKAACQTVEAAAIAREVRQWLDTKLPVHDKTTGKTREIRNRDIAVLSRTWDALDHYGDALAAAGIPAVHAGGGNLLETREVMDAIALLTFLADEQDDLALVATLRSPFFALSDRDLQLFAQTLKKDRSWWEMLRGTVPPAFARALEVLTALRAARPNCPPRRLLQRADELTGYGAVIANLPGASRREADWRGFLELLSEWERNGFNDAFLAVRRLRTLIDAGVSLPRPPLDAGNAVSLMTVHAAKGLEWPIVIVPDLARKPPADYHRVRLDPQLGVAFGFDDEEDERQKPAILTLIDARRAEREAAESRRVLYVALTRARDRVLLTSAATKGHALDILTPGLLAAGIEVREIAFNEADARPPDIAPSPPLARPSRTLLDPIPRTVTEVRITDLQEYSVCPKRFHYHVVLGYPDPTREEPDGAETEEPEGITAGATDGIETMPEASVAGDELPLFAQMHTPIAPAGESPADRQARRIGILAHRALELGLATPEDLAPFDTALEPEQVADALRLAETFRTDPAFARFNGPDHSGYRREWPIVHQDRGIRLIGTIDLAGPDFVLDYKTGRNVSLEEYRYQLWAYARAAGVSTAYLADLRQGTLHTLNAADLDATEAEAASILDRLRAGDFAATPSLAACLICPYSNICPDSLARS
jgi:ATP-dependent helicase/nuclease subunit A